MAAPVGHNHLPTLRARHRPDSCAAARANTHAAAVAWQSVVAEQQREEEFSCWRRLSWNPCQWDRYQWGTVVVSFFATGGALILYHLYFSDMAAERCE